MVREARFAWDAGRPLPLDLSRRNWDFDDPDQEPEETATQRRVRRLRSSRKRTDGKKGERR